jgi:hypothetical protein
LRPCRRGRVAVRDRWSGVATGETWITELTDDEPRDLLAYDPSGEEG